MLVFCPRKIAQEGDDSKTAKIHVVSRQHRELFTSYTSFHGTCSRNESSNYLSVLLIRSCVGGGRQAGDVSLDIKSFRSNEARDEGMRVINATIVVSARACLLATFSL